MKRVLFLGVSHYNFSDFPPLHLEEKFLGLGASFRCYVLARGKPFHKKIWETDFYLLSHFFFWPKAFFLAFYLCLAKKIDVIVAQSPLLEGFVGAILSKILRKELIVEIHGDWWEGPFLSKRRRFEKIEKKIVPILAKSSLKSADKIRVVAEYLKKEAQKIVPGKPYFIFPTFTDLSLFLNEKNISFENFILFVGQLEKVKGVEYLIEAFSKIRQEFPNFKLVIVGDGSERNNLKLQVTRYRLQDKIEFKGKLYLEETKNIMKRCYCLVLPSLSEGLPRAILEAMALGKPVVASNVGGIPEIIKDGDNGFLFEVKNSYELAQRLKELLTNKPLAQKMGETGKKIAESSFSNEIYIENYVKMIYS